MASTKQFKNAKKFQEQGAWVYPIPGCFDVKVKIRGLWNADMTLAHNEARQSVSATEWGDKEFQDQLQLRLLCEHLLLDWANIEDEDGKPIPFTVDAARELLGDPEMIYLRVGFLWAADNVGARGRENIEDIAKN